MSAIATRPTGPRQPLRPRGSQRPASLRRRSHTARPTGLSRLLRGRWAKTGSAKKAPPSPTANLTITTHVRELTGVEAQQRADRQLAALARLLQRAAAGGRR